MSESTPPTSEEPRQTAPDATAADAHGTRPAASGGPAPAPDDPDASTVDYGRPFTVEFDPTGEEPPVIDPSELAALEPVSETTTRVRRVQPLVDEPSGVVARYLFPTERYRGEWRHHPIFLATPITVAVVATIGIGLGGGFLQAGMGAGWVAPLAFLAWLGVMGWVAWKVAYWHFERFILTNKRVMVVHGIITRHVAMMPLERVTDMKYEQTPLGRILNYGTFVLESAGQDQALREVAQLPNPNELYLRVVEEMYEPAAVEARMGNGDEEEEQRPGES